MNTTPTNPKNPAMPATPPVGETRPFSLRDILTVTTGYLLTKSPNASDNGIGNLYEIIDWMTGDEAYTHTLGRFADKCKPWLLRWFPELAKADAYLPELEKLCEGSNKSSRPETDKAIEGWIIRVIGQTGCKTSYDVPRIPKDDHAIIDPYDELIIDRGTDEGIIIIGHD